MTTISEDEYSLKRTKKHYQEVLIKGGHKHELVYNAEKRNCKKRKSKNILHFTSPFCTTVETKLVNDSLKLLAKILTQRTVGQNV